jgi:hypothetical protein
MSWVARASRFVGKGGERGARIGGLLGNKGASDGGEMSCIVVGG